MPRKRMAFGGLAAVMIGVVACGFPSCGPGPARRAWAMAVGPAGRVIWQERLPTGPQQPGIALRPLVFGGTGVFAEMNAVYGLRLSDGRQLWRVAFPASAEFLAGAVYGLCHGAAA